MVREKLMKHHAPDGFRWRGGEIARIEGLSDAVFAFAVTLLVVSLEVPKTYNELFGVMRGFFAFAICFALLMQVWYEQYTFFRRYNLQDRVTVTLNAVLLFVVLVYVYPLKFLFTVLTNLWMHAGMEVRLPGGQVEPMIEPHQMPQLTAIFSGGYLAVALVFVVLFWRAWRRRHELELNALEQFDTRVTIGTWIIQSATAFVSLIVALFGGGLSATAGIVYPILLAPGLTIYYTVMGRKKRLLQAKQA